MNDNPDTTDVFDGDSPSGRQNTLLNRLQDIRTTLGGTAIGAAVVASLFLSRGNDLQGTPLDPAAPPETSGPRIAQLASEAGIVLDIKDYVLLQDLPLTKDLLKEYVDLKAKCESAMQEIVMIGQPYKGLDGQRHVIPVGLTCATRLPNASIENYKTAIEINGTANDYLPDGLVAQLDSLLYTGNPAEGINFTETGWGGSEYEGGFFLRMYGVYQAEYGKSEDDYEDSFTPIQTTEEFLQNISWVLEQQGLGPCSLINITGGDLNEQLTVSAEFDGGDIEVTLCNFINPTDNSYSSNSLAMTSLEFAGIPDDARIALYNELNKYQERAKTLINADTGIYLAVPHPDGSLGLISISDDSNTYAFTKINMKERFDIGDLLLLTPGLIGAVAGGMYDFKRNIDRRKEEREIQIQNQNASTIQSINFDLRDLETSENSTPDAIMKTITELLNVNDKVRRNPTLNLQNLIQNEYTDIIVNGEVESHVANLFYETLQGLVPSQDTSDEEYNTAMREAIRFWHPAPGRLKQEFNEIGDNLLLRKTPQQQTIPNFTVEFSGNDDKPSRDEQRIQKGITEFLNAIYSMRSRNEIESYVEGISRVNMDLNSQDLRFVYTDKGMQFSIQIDPESSKVIVHKIK